MLHIIICDDFSGWFPSPEHPYVTLFSKIAPGIEFAVHDAVRGELPGTPDPDGVYLIGGSRKSVYEKDPWILDLLAWIRFSHGQGARLAGICFGHQALCEALGGRVLRAPEWWVGRRSSRVVSERLSRAVAGDGAESGRVTLHYHHHDQVVQLPPGAEVLAASDFCPVEAFALGERVIGFQGHPEFSVETMRLLLAQPLEDFSPEQRRRAAAGMDSGPQAGFLPDGLAAAGMILRLREPGAR